MPLSNELISQFVRTINNDKKTSNEATVYGTVRGITNDDTVTILGVQLDGSDVITPVMTTTEYKINERVAVRIKDHTATVTGNISSPAARTDTVKEVDGKVDTVDGKVDTVDEKVDGLTDVVAENLKATNAEIEKLKVKDANIENLVGTNITSTNAEIENLKAKDAAIDKLVAEKANVVDLNTANANIENLKATTAKIDTLMFGAASGDVIQTEFSNSVIAQLGDAHIKDAMIESLSVDKLLAGSIDTNKVTVQSTEGNLAIAKNTIQIKDDNQRVRVQIGKDASDDYSINVWDENGNLMFSKGGLTKDAIKDKIIVNDMVDDNANISASKLDIGSMFTKNNDDGSYTINANHILFDAENQTLTAAFDSMTTKVDGVKETVTSQGTQITEVQGKIDSKVWQQEIVTPHVDEAVAKINIGGTNLVLNSRDAVENTNYGITNFPYADPTKIIPGETYTISFDGMLSDPTQTGFYINTYPAPNRELVSLNAIATDGQYHHYEGTFTMPDNGSFTVMCIYAAPTYDNFERKLAGVKNVKLEKGNKATDWSPAPEETESSVSELRTKYSDLEQDVDGFKATVRDTYATTSDVDDVEKTLSNKYTTLEQNVDGFKTTVSSTYATKDAVDNLDINGRNLLSNTLTPIENSDYILARFPYTDPTEIVSGEKYTVSFDGMLSDSSQTAFYINTYPAPHTGCATILAIASDGKYHRHEYTFTMPENKDNGVSNYTELGVYAYPLNSQKLAGIKNVKLEKGDKATYYTPAPEEYSVLKQTVSGLDLELGTVTDKVAHIKIGSDENGDPYMSMTKEFEIGEDSGFKWGFRANGNMGLTWTEGVIDNG